jgi:cytochrome c oxidase assembly factor CtaG
VPPVATLRPVAIIPPPVAFGLCFTALIASRIIQERALAKLSTEAKGRLVEAFAAHRMVALVPLAAIAALYFAMASLDVLTTKTLLALYIPLVLLFVAGSQLYVHRKLRTLGLDPEYRRAHGLGRGLGLLGVAVLLLAV